jgi:N-acetylneuraminic acid mutarotase
MPVTKTGAALIGAALVVPLVIAVWLILRIFNDDKAGSPGAVSTMGTARWNHTATLLPNGKVLIVGGLARVANAVMPISLSSTELYDPSSNSWSPSGALAIARESHTATLLPSGKVLVVGGVAEGHDASRTAELYDSASESWSPAGKMAKARSSYWGHTATLLLSGKVLVAAGSRGSATDGTAELYDPSTNTWSSAGRMLDGYSHPEAVLLPSGNVLVVGYDSPELYKPSSDTWSSASAGGWLWRWLKSIERQDHTATLLLTGKVLIAGGTIGGTKSKHVTSSINLYDPSSNSWSSASMLHARAGHTATLLPGGKVLVAGGGGRLGLNSSAELYDPSSDTWSEAGRLANARAYHTATLLPSGEVLFAGGQGNSGPLSSAELYDPSQATQTR